MKPFSTSPQQTQTKIATSWIDLFPNNQEVIDTATKQFDKAAETINTTVDSINTLYKKLDHIVLTEKSTATDISTLTDKIDELTGKLNTLTQSDTAVIDTCANALDTLIDNSLSTLSLNNTLTQLGSYKNLQTMLDNIDHSKNSKDKSIKWRTEGFSGFIYKLFHFLSNSICSFFDFIICMWILLTNNRFCCSLVIF